MNWTGCEWLIFGMVCGTILGIIVNRKDWLRFARIVMGKETDIVTDERTEKIVGKAAARTIVVIMVVIAIILFGNVLNLFGLETKLVLGIIFFSMLISMNVLLKYYESKEI
ncbi:MAG: DUF2178 domain-containing protein [Candidatus Aenigmarchaeota archaeon]|nr:DUF2178 domain-containing protein [Candidatus Aenigmarchaeota archaeon]